jgi:hypothetical protein
MSASAADIVTCYRPTGPKELALVRESGFRRWPPRLPEQPIFYPVCNEEYAIQIARDWNAPQSGIGYVTRFRVRRKFMERYPVQTVGAGTHTEWWIPAEDLNAMNENIVGFIEVIGEFRPKSEPASGGNVE